MNQVLMIACLVMMVGASCGSLPLEDEARPGPGGGGAGGGGRYHPDGWADPAQHGQALKTQQEDCRTCHGEDLLGGGTAIPGCDDCHDSGWRTNCTFCHGGTDNTLGSPPRDLSGETNRASLSFPAHTAHVSRTSHPAYDCTQCHLKPTDVLSPGHVFDDTPGRAELDFSQGLSRAGTYANGSCASLYCHGNGRGANGTYARDRGAPSCSTCHPDRTTSALWSSMSGRHRIHLGRGYLCRECHGNTVNATSDGIANPDLHVNGRADLAFPTSTIRYSAGACSGTCHGEGHSGNRW